LQVAKDKIRKLCIVKKKNVRSVEKFMFGEEEYFLRTKIGYARYGRTSSQATESGNSVGKGPSPTGFGYACFKNPVLALITKANWSTAKLQFFLESRRWKNWDKEITPYLLFIQYF
jgi:hypothetical protein